VQKQTREHQHESGYEQDAIRFTSCPMHAEGDQQPIRQLPGCKMKLTVVKKNCHKHFSQQTGFIKSGNRKTAIRQS
jgi:hypothetical protein